MNKEQFKMLVSWGYTDKDIALFFSEPVERVAKARLKLQKLGEVS